MSSPFNDNNGNGFDKKIKNKKLNRTTVITIVTLAIAIIIVATAAIISNKTKQTTPLPDASSTQKPTEQTTEEQPTEDTAEETPTEKPADTQTNSSAVSGKLPAFALPVSGVLSSKHNPDLQVFSPTMNDYRVHLGIDIMTEASAPVYPAAKGKITQISDDPMWGKCIWIEHSGDAVSVYRGLADELPEGIKVGTTVNVDTVIGAVGDGGILELADEPHLHFEMKIKGADVDPIEYFSKSALETLSESKDTAYEG